MYKATLSSRGQIVIPAEMRKKLSLKAGASFRLYDHGEKIVLIREVEDPVVQGLGLLKRQASSQEESHLDV
jgi:AbrB family looped-hinge helix DNA binding protein